ncbi:MAG TPA: hypothetical protein VMW75_03560 [Thermoanaerobaculia bacterium]|nr:hypothetical protein [Thermoanaerobaculia bacterium]
MALAPDDPSAPSGVQVVPASWLLIAELPETLLLPLAEFEAVREIVEDERRQRAIRAVALRNAGE